MEHTLFLDLVPRVLEKEPLEIQISMQGNKNSFLMDDSFIFNTLLGVLQKSFGLLALTGQSTRLSLWSVY